MGLNDSAKKIKTSLPRGNATPQQEAIYIPNSSITRTIDRAITASNDPKHLAEQDSKYSVKTVGADTVFTHKGKNIETQLIMADIQNTIGPNKRKWRAYWFFHFTLSKLVEKGYNNLDGLFKDEISFPLEDLIKTGAYENKDSARKAWRNTAEPALTSIKVKADIKSDRKGSAKTVTPDGGTMVLFDGVTVEKGVCRVYLNNRLNWKPILEFYQKAPPWFYELKERPFSLANEIFYLARTKKREIEKNNGKFKISFNDIKIALDLPDIGETKNPGRDIQMEIKDAVDAVMKKDQEAETDSLNIEIKGPGIASNINDYMNNGYLEVELRGEYLDYVLEKKEKQDQIVTEMQQRKQKIIEANTDKKK